jgi:hypothetical protein
MTLWFIRFANGSKAGQAVRLAPGRNRVGRKPDCEICLSDPGISGLHASIEITENNAILRDEDSLNGTYVKDFSISRHEVAPGLEISFGLVRAHLEKLDRPQPAEVIAAPPSETAASGAVDKAPFKSTIPVKIPHKKRQVPPVSISRPAISVREEASPSRVLTKSVVTFVLLILLTALVLWLWLGNSPSSASSSETQDHSTLAPPEIPAAVE